MSENIVIKFGGSLLFNEDRTINSGKIEEFCQILKSNTSFNKTIIVCGGGLFAREYIKSMRELGSNEALCDLIGIEVSRLNSMIIRNCLKHDAVSFIPRSVEELSLALMFDGFIVMGGLQPGQSTTSVSLEVSEYINSKKIVILTDVDGIYDKDPKKNSDAKMYKKISLSELQTLILKSAKNKQASAGEYRIFDAVSLQILKRSKIKAYIMSGLNLKEFKKFWNGSEDIHGTIIME